MNYTRNKQFFANEVSIGSIVLFLLAGAFCVGIWGGFYLLLILGVGLLIVAAFKILRGFLGPWTAPRAKEINEEIEKCAYGEEQLVEEAVKALGIDEETEYLYCGLFTPIDASKITVKSKEFYTDRMEQGLFLFDRSRMYFYARSFCLIKDDVKVVTESFLLGEIVEITLMAPKEIVPSIAGKFPLPDFNNSRYYYWWEHYKMLHIRTHTGKDFYTAAHCSTPIAEQRLNDICDMVRKYQNAQYE